MKSLSLSGTAIFSYIHPVWPLELRYSGGTAAANRARRSVGKMEVLPRMPHDRVVVNKQHERAEVGGWRLMCRRGPRIVCFEPGIGHGDSLGRQGLA